jgi:hypothetical protein
MPEIKKVEIETEETPPPAQPSLPETNIQMAIEYGRMTKTNEAILAEIQADRSERSQVTAMLNETMQRLNELKLQTDTTSHQTEILKESQAAILSEMTEDSESDDKATLDVTPMLETKVEIKAESKPVKNKSLLQRIFF